MLDPDIFLNFCKIYITKSILPADYSINRQRAVDNGIE